MMLPRSAACGLLHIVLGSMLVLLLPASAAALAPEALALHGDVAFTHDPSIAWESGTYYVFSTGRAPGGGQLPIRCSTDLHTWKLCGHVFAGIPAWIRQRSPKTRDLWAPDISHEHGEYRLYYAFSRFGENTSGIALATNVTLDPASPNYRWVDRGLVLASTCTDDFNAIDPNYAQDTHGGGWLSFGSFWTGIKLRRLDPATGMPSPGDTRLYSLASRSQPQPLPAQRLDPDHPVLPPDWTAVEVPFLLHRGRWYYLFVSWDLCCRGVHSTYRTMVGRAREITGPYLDRSGRPMLQGGGTELLVRNRSWVGPGGASVLDKGGRQFLVFHAYDAVTGRPSLQISSLTWKHGWPAAALGSQ